MKFMWKALAVGSLLLTLHASALAAQETGPRIRADTSIAPARNAGAIRFFGALGGSFVGTIGGAYLGYNILPHNCGCDDPGLDQLIWGGLAGSAIGAAIGASAANLGSQCDFPGRFKRSLLGASIGGIAAYFVAGGSSNEGTVIAVPAVAIGGSLAALGRCWKAR
ncbi:MAG TPA: hypothetical protein VF042_02175 [Gemmatimonadaceae bacterium]